uniref:HAD family hydrolase n=1 Tax=Flavobacterium sp. TaxID=239 RepID=UPI00404B07FC
MKPEDFKIILWDFDGVIINSNSVREAGFRKVLGEYPEEQVEKLIAYHNINGGLSRYVKFRYFFEKIRNEVVSEEIINDLAKNFSFIMKEYMPDNNLLIAPIINFIKMQYSVGKFMHIVSGSDELELRWLCEKLGIDYLFKSINGSPTDKSKLIANIIKNDSEVPFNYCLIGDSINDYEAAKNNSITFFGYNNPKLKNLDFFLSLE